MLSCNQVVEEINDFLLAMVMVGLVVCYLSKGKLCTVGVESKYGMVNV